MHDNVSTQEQSGVIRAVPNLGGPMMTASGVAFLSGTIDYFVRGYDVRTGEQLWRSRLPAGGHGSLRTKAGDYVIAYALPR